MPEPHRLTLRQNPGGSSVHCITISLPRCFIWGWLRSIVKAVAVLLSIGNLCMLENPILHVCLPLKLDAGINLVLFFDPSSFRNAHLVFFHRTPQLKNLNFRLGAPAQQLLLNCMEFAKQTAVQFFGWGDFLSSSKKVPPPSTCQLPMQTHAPNLFSGKVTMTMVREMPFSYPGLHATSMQMANG